MTIQLRRRATNRKNLYNVIYDDFSDGSNTNLSEASLGPKMAKQATNLMQVENGKWKTRMGSKPYGQALPNGANIDGFYEYVKSDGTTELIAIGIRAYKSTDGGTWSEVLLNGGSSASYTAGIQIYFIQIGQRLYIANGDENLAYYDGTNIKSYTEISAPSWGGTPLARTTLTSGSFNVYYQVTALNDIGETVGNTEQTITVNKDRNSWTGGEKITLTWSAVSGATRYQVYYSDETGFENLIDSTTNTTYDDDGTKALNPYIEVPDDNTTGAPKFTHMELSGNRIWATNDPDNKYRVYFSGTGQYIGYFSDFYGGGWIDLEKGGRDMPRAVVHYRTGKGDSIITVLCSSPEGKGSIWQVDLASVTVESDTFVVPSAVKIIGSVGTNAPLSVVKMGNSVMFHNKSFFSVLGNKANVLNVLSNDEASYTIRPSVLSLEQSKISGICGYIKDGRIFYSVPTSSTGNDRIYIYDTERRNWQTHWSLGVRQFGEYTETGGQTRFLGAPISGSQLIEISENISGDSGESFPTSYISGLYSIDKDRTVFAKIDRAYIELANPRGNVSFALLGTEKGKSYSQIGSINISTTISQTGATWDKPSTFRFSTSSGTPTTFSQSSVRKSIRVRKLLNNYQFKVTSSGLYDQYTLLSLQVKGKIVGTRDPSSWSD